MTRMARSQKPGSGDGKRVGRWSRRVIWLVLLCFLSTAQPANAATFAPASLNAGGIASWLSGLFASHPAPVLPVQRSGHAGRGGQVPAAVTRRAGKAAGNAVRKAHGQLPAYHPYCQKFVGSRADAHGRKGAFNTRTSRFVAGKQGTLFDPAPYRASRARRTMALL
jgi:hypothetical protein